MSTLGADWKAGDDIILSTPNANSGNLVGDHMYEVIGVNASAGTITLENPWNTAYSGSLAMSFTETIKQLASAGCTLYATTGTRSLKNFGAAPPPTAPSSPALRPNRTAARALSFQAVLPL